MRTLLAAVVSLAALATVHEVSAIGPSGLPNEPPTFLRDPAALSEGPGFDVVPGELVVDVKDDATPAEINDLARDYGLTLAPNSIFSGPSLLERALVSHHGEAPVAVDPALIARLAHDPRVEGVEPMAVLFASFVPNDPLYAEKQWHLKGVGAERAWEYGCGEGATVAVIDTGVACFDQGAFTRGTDLAGTRCEGGYNFVDDTDQAHDDHGHGTHVAGTIAQTTNNGKGVAGLAHCARLMPVKVLNKNGWGTVADVAEGIRYAADHGANVINMSLGGNIKSRVLEAAVVHAQKKGVVVVAAAGNSGRSVGWPAAYPGVVAVSATDRNGNLAWFSSRGPEVVLGAPGVNVTQQTVCDGGKNKCELFGTFNGTSMAAPHVAGASALLIGMGVNDPDAVVARLRETAVPKSNAEHFGAGILDAGAAMARVFWMHLFLRLGALVAFALVVARHIRRRGGEFARTPGARVGAFVAALVASVGVLPVAPLFGLRTHSGPFRTAVELAMRPVGEWDLVLSGPGLHAWLLLASAIPTVALTALFFGVRRARPLLGGFALGAAALLAQLTIQADVAAPFGSFVMRVFAVANAAVCLWIARIALDRKKA